MSTMKSHINSVSVRMGLRGEITDEVKRIATEEFEMTIDRVRTYTSHAVIEKAREEFARTLDHLSAEQRI